MQMSTVQILFAICLRKARPEAYGENLLRTDRKQKLDCKDVLLLVDINFHDAS